VVIHKPRGRRTNEASTEGGLDFGHADQREIEREGALECARGLIAYAQGGVARVGIEAARIQPRRSWGRRGGEGALLWWVTAILGDAPHKGRRKRSEEDQRGLSPL